MKLSRSHLIAPNFFPQAEQMRAHIDAHFGNPYGHRPKSHGIWNYWYVPGHYTYFKSEPGRIFPKPLIAAFYARLEKWARWNLGLSFVAGPYLSFYVNGCGQNLHNDAENGRFAFVYSLTRWGRRSFTGGETVLMDETDYWSTGRYRRNASLPHYSKTIPARFNQLLVFDERLLHSVPVIHGQMDPQEARIVIHGHLLAEEKIYVEGALETKKVTPNLAPTYERIRRLALSEHGKHSGYFSLRLAIERNGRVREVKLVANRVLGIGERPFSGFDKQIRESIRLLKTLRFPPAKAGTTTITLPIVVGWRLEGLSS